MLKRAAEGVEKILRHCRGFQIFISHTHLVFERDRPLFDPISPDGDSVAQAQRYQIQTAAPKGVIISE